MIPLIALSQLSIGTKLRIVGHSSKDNYGSVSVKRLIACENDSEEWTEVLINRRKNFYFHLDNFLNGKSHWVKEVYILEGKDRRLKGSHERR